MKPLDVRWLGNEVFVGFDSDYAQFVRAEALGGVTLFAASSPGGPLVARLVYPPPFAITLEGQPAAIFPNVPSGTDHIVAVYGIVATPAVAASDWQRLDVGLSPPCATVPKSALIRDEQLVNGFISVALFFSSTFRCATSFLLEAGSAPGLAILANFEYASQVLLSSTIPVGTYYLYASAARTPLASVPTRSSFP